jgi:hypothetical protein
LPSHPAASTAPVYYKQLSRTIPITYQHSAPSGVAPNLLPLERAITKTMSEQQTAIPLNRATAELTVDRTNIDLTDGEFSSANHTARPLAKIRDVLKWCFSFPAMLAACLVGRVFYQGRNFSVDPDLWWHIKIGQDLLRTHHFPATDPYSWTVPGQPWIAYEWLGDIALALVNRAGGLLALDIFLIVLGSLIMLAIYALASARAENSKAGFVSAVILSTLAFGSFSMRPQMFGYLFLALTALILLQFRKGVSWPVWTLPAIFLLWVNTHGSFIIGIGVIGLYLCSGLWSFRLGNIEAVAWTRKQRLQLETVFLLCLAVLPITPYGTKLAVYPFDMAFSQPLNVANIMEWKPMPFDIAGGKIFLGLLVIFFLLQMFFQFTWKFEELALALGGAVMACIHVRFVLLFVPFFAPIFAAAFARWIPPYKKAIDKYALNALLMTAILVAMIHYCPTQKKLQDKVGEKYPSGALQYLSEHPVSGKLLNTYGYGGYMVLAGTPTFIDGRGDLFERGGVLADYLHIMNLLPGAYGVLRNYDISVCLLNSNEALSIVLLESPDWNRVYVDRTSSIFVRREVSGRAAH